MVQSLDTLNGYKESEGKLIYDVDWEFMKDIAIRMAQNKGKYEKYNWKKPIDLNQLDEAIERHWVSYKSGDLSEDHEIAIVCNIMMKRYHTRHQKIKT